MRKPSRARGSSSTSKAVKGMSCHQLRFRTAGRNAIGNHHRHHNSALLAIFHRQAPRIAVKLTETRPRIRQSHSRVVRRGGRGTARPPPPPPPPALCSPRATPVLVAGRGLFPPPGGGGCFSPKG